jgi:hypothetical protein
MDDNLTLQVLYAFGSKYYELQQGFAAMFNLCLRAGVFTDSQFHVERRRILSSPEMAKWGQFLEDPKKAKAQADLEEALRKYEGPIQ